MEIKFYYIPIDWIVDLIKKKILTEIDIYSIGKRFYEDVNNNSLMGILKLLDKLGWGTLKIVAYSSEYIIISGKSILAKLMLKYYGPQREPVDHFILGVLDAWAEDNGLDIKFEEVECIAKGDDKCVFVGKPPGSE